MCVLSLPSFVTNRFYIRFLETGHPPFYSFPVLVGIHHFSREHPPNSGTGLLILGQHYPFRSWLRWLDVLLPASLGCNQVGRVCIILPRFVSERKLAGKIQVCVPFKLRRGNHHFENSPCRGVTGSIWVFLNLRTLSGGWFPFGVLLSPGKKIYTLNPIFGVTGWFSTVKQVGHHPICASWVTFDTHTYIYIYICIHTVHLSLHPRVASPRSYSKANPKRHRTHVELVTTPPLRGSQA